MPAVTIRDVPDDTRDALASRAALNGQSLQEYLRASLIAMAERPDIGALMAEVRNRKAVTSSNLTADEILEHLSRDRR